MQEKTLDLADGTFVEKWPHWLRWLLFLPSAVIAPVIFLIIQSIFQNWFLDIGEDAFYFVLMRSVIYGAGFVWVGATVAPNHQKAIAVMLLVIVAMFAGAGILSAILVKASLMDYVEATIIIVSASYVMYSIVKES